MYRFWGKLDNDGKQSCPVHLLVYHSLDVAACGHTLLTESPEILTRILNLWGLPDSDRENVKGHIVALMALHDLGKFDLHFQCMHRGSKAESVAITRGLRIPEDGTQYNAKNNHHSVVGWRLWAEDFDLDRTKRVSILDGTRWASSWNDVAGCILAHHGAPPTNEDGGDRKSAESLVRESDVRLTIRSFILEADKVLSDVGILPPPWKPPIPRLPVELSHDIAALAIIADWLGSDQWHFKYKDTPMPLRDYWEATLKVAQRAISKSDVIHKAIVKSTAPDIQTLFPHIQNPTPLQQTCWDLEPEPATLYMIEDTMGSGKTEAGLLLAHKCLTKGLVKGCYFALPTRATTDGIYRRLLGTVLNKDACKSEYLSHTFTETANVSIALAHATATLTRKRAKLEFDRIALEIEGTESDEGELGTASSNRMSWYRGSKRALGADFGVGTIDQALMAVIAVKHWALRMHFLSQKVVILDEVHSYDAHTFMLCRILIRALVSRGLPVIVMSATLCQRDRQLLAAEALHGRATWVNQKERDLSMTPSAGIPLDKAFPAVTIVGNGTPKVIPVQGVYQRRVVFAIRPSWQSVSVSIRKALASGKNVCLLRNTVKSAQETYLQYQDLNPLVIHARFLPPDRAQKEQSVERIAGRRSSSQDREGKLVIATQVVEQSLDLDFDLLFTDLAPLDVLLQRSGRCWRHLRDERGNPAESESRVGDPVVTVIAPAPEGIKTWKEAVREICTGSPLIYSVADLWLTLRTIERNPDILVPRDTRRLMTEVYESKDVPKDVQDARTTDAKEYLEKSTAAGWQGTPSAIAKSFAKSGMSVKSDDRPFVTRDTIGTITARLAVLRDGCIQPYYPVETQGGDLSLAWEESTISLYSYMVGIEPSVAFPKVHANDYHAQIQRDKVLDELPDKGKFSTLLIGKMTGRVFQVTVPKGILEYCPTLGMRKLK